MLTFSTVPVGIGSAIAARTTNAAKSSARFVCFARGASEHAIPAAPRNAPSTAAATVPE